MIKSGLEAAPVSLMTANSPGPELRTATLMVMILYDDDGDDGDGDDGIGEETKRAAKETCGSSEFTGPVQQGGVKGRFFKVFGRFFFPSHFLFATLLAGANERAWAVH